MQILPKNIFFSQMDKMFLDKKIQSVHIYMKDAKCAETNEKSVFCFSYFLIFEIWSFYYGVNFSMNFEYKVDHNSKMKNLQNQKIDFSLVSAHCVSFL